mmetsp:Transcript_39672/g.88981  ORF Transcript_39672/g.88981 Transcript_39672/m.88981 type:complete len:386 (+) Transcript_39672:2-1159(+)
MSHHGRGAQHRHLSRAEKSEAREWFKKLDADGGGSVSPDELGPFFTSIGIHASLPEIKRAITTFAGDQEELDEDGFCALWERILSMTKKRSRTAEPRHFFTPIEIEKYTKTFHMVARMNADGDPDKIDLQELQFLVRELGMNIERDRLKTIMKTVDSDGSGVIDLDEFLVLLAKIYELPYRNITPRTAAREGWSVASLRNMGYESAHIAELKAFPAKDLIDADLPAKDLVQHGYTPRDLKQGGWNGDGARDQGFTVDQMMEAGFNIKSIRKSGWQGPEGTAELRAVGMAANKLKRGGFTPMELKLAGFSAYELRNLGFSNSVLAGLKRKMGEEQGIVEPGKTVLTPRTALMRAGEFSMAARLESAREQLSTPRVRERCATGRAVL